MADVVSVYRLTMDIKKPTSHIVTPVIVQYDNVRLEVTVLDDGKPFDLTNVTDIEFVHKRPDLEVIVEPGTLEDGKIVYRYVGNEMDIPGNVKTSFSMINGDEKVSVRDFYVVVTQDLKESQYIPGAPKVDRLQELIVEVENLSASTQAIGEEAQTQGEYAKEQGDYAKEQGDYVVSQSGKLEDLEVQYAPRLNAVEEGLTKKAGETETFQQLVPKNHSFGDQLSNMKYALSNPLEQYMSIVFLGDSITWGLGATGNPADYNTGRDGTLSDIRDNFNSLSWVNTFKRYIGANYMRNASPILSNHPSSTGGQSIVEYNRQISLYPFGGDFSLVSDGVGATVLERPLASSLLGRQLVLNVQSAQQGEHVVSFNFTGKEFTISYDSVDTSMDYNLLVDGVSQGVFSTAPGVDGNVLGSDNRRTHTFDYVKDAVIEIKTSKTSLVGLQTLRIAGVLINKRIRISNQGLIGLKAFNYAARTFPGNSNGDGVSIEPDDNYVFVQLGTNDRIISTDYAKGVNAFKSNLSNLVNLIKNNNRQIVLMVSNPAANENPSTFSFTMQDVRNAVYQLAKANEMDMVDNFSIYGNMNIADYTTDLLHLNDYGNKIMARNIINSLETL